MSAIAADNRPVIAVTMGDPSGVGAEIIVKALRGLEVHDRCRPVVVGDIARLRKAARLCDMKFEYVTVDDADLVHLADDDNAVPVLQVYEVPDALPFGKVSAAAGEAAYQYIQKASELAMRGVIGGICTAPINKESLHTAGHVFPGHTELLAHLTGTAEVSMMLTGGGLNVVHVTTHVGLLDAIEQIEPGLVTRTITRAHDAMRTAITNRPPRIAVCGINPHAGEHGLFGRGEEEQVILPGVRDARGAGIDAHGPLPADTAFFRALRGDFDVVVAMYHDQGHCPVKVLGIDNGVNVTIGLPVIRTSVEHGTAFDIAGTGLANEAGLVRALIEAGRLAALSRPG